MRYPETDKQFPLIIISHGFKGWKDWGFLPYISEQLAESGAITICFNYSLNGMIDGSVLVENPNDFASNTVSAELEDLDFLITSFIDGKIESTKKIDAIWNGEIFLLGHSMGGGISLLLTSQQERSYHRMIKAISLWASVGKWDRYTARQKAEWRKTGYVEFLNNRTSQTLRIDIGWLNDMENHSYYLSLTAAAARLDVPALLVHGRQDKTIPISEIELLINSDKNNMLKTHYINTANHTFGSDMIMGNPSATLIEALDITKEFYKGI